MQEHLPFEYEFERLLDDWVLLGFLVGNDFLPHLPYFHIGEVSHVIFVDLARRGLRMPKDVLAQLTHYISLGTLKINTRTFCQWCTTATSV